MRLSAEKVGKFYELSPIFETELDEGYFELPATLTVGTHAIDFSGSWYEKVGMVEIEAHKEKGDQHLVTLRNGCAELRALSAVAPAMEAVPFAKYVIGDEKDGISQLAQDCGVGLPHGSFSRSCNQTYRNTVAAIVKAARMKRYARLCFSILG